MNRIFSFIKYIFNFATYAIVLKIICYKTFRIFRKYYGKFITIKDNHKSQINGLGNVTGIYLGELVIEIKKAKNVKSILLDGDDNSCKPIIKSLLKQNEIQVTTTGLKGNYDYDWNFENNPPAKIGKFDLIISQAMIEHLINPYKHISDLSKMLNRKGRLIVHSVMPGYEYHRHPIDTLRFFPDWFQEVGSRLELKILRKYIRNSHIVYCYEKH